MKNCFKILMLIIATSLIFGCKNTESNLVNNLPVKYYSRCESHLNSNDDKVKYGELISTRAPKYPAQAAVNGQEGYVMLEFDISENGKPININIMESLPAKTFDEAAIYSLKGWQYEPIANICYKVRLDFTLG